MTLTAEKLEEFRQSWRPTQEKVDLAVKTAIEVAHPSRVIVFGSWARDEATVDSDLDLAVFVPDEREDEIGELRKKIRSGLDGLRMSIDLIIAPEGYVREFLSSINSVYYQIINEGKLVYDAGHFARIAV
ncbi:MAG: nucleotidyltransferase domain-containing protein [Terracidiphilus sp.]